MCRKFMILTKLGLEAQAKEYQSLTIFQSSTYITFRGRERFHLVQPRVCNSRELLYRVCRPVDGLGTICILLCDKNVSFKIRRRSWFRSTIVAVPQCAPEEKSRYILHLKHYFQIIISTLVFHC